MRGYFGGLYTMSSQMADVVEKTVEWADTGEFKLTTRDSFKDLLYVKW